MSPRFTLLLSLALSCGALFAQSGGRTDTPFDKEHIPDGAALKAAQAALKKGEGFFREGGNFFSDALEQFAIAHAVNPHNADLNMKMGLCHLNGRHHHKALTYFQAAYALDNSLPRIHFLMGMGHQLNADWDKAMAEYALHRAVISRVPDTEALYNSADQRITECKNGKSLQAKPVSAQVSNLGASINSPQADYGVLVTADAARMWFTSRRAPGAGGRLNKTTNEYFEDIYQCDRTTAGWSAPQALPAPVNAEFNDASVGLFNDGRTMIIYRDNAGAGDLFESTRDGEVWSEPISMGEHINSPANETSAWFSTDRKQLYFVSDREGGLGGQDIWMSRWDASAQAWGPAQNLGPTVNTYEDEDGVFVHPDGTSLYFSSKGHTSMGGFDVFRSTFVDGRWSKPANMGWPVNSPDDDLFFVLTANGTTGYFSSIRADGFGEDDIYRVDLLPDGRGEETASMGGGASFAAPEKTAAVIKGRITDPERASGMFATIDLIDLTTARSVATFSSDATSGTFIAELPGSGSYAMHVRAGGYLLRSQRIDLSAGGTMSDGEVLIEMLPLETDQVAVLPNIRFEGAEARLAPSGLAELGGVLTLLQENPSLRLEVGAHLPAGADADQSEQLSTARAAAIVGHLVANGIAADRLVAKGYGASKPLTISGSQTNAAAIERIELRVL